MSVTGEAAVIPFVDLVAQHRALRAELAAKFGEVLDSASFILGEHLERFEGEFARYVGTPYAVGVNSGLDALRLSLSALDIGPGDEVILPTNSFVATALAVSAVGARPVLVDCDPDTYGIDVSGVARAVTPRTRAIIPVHLAGQAVDLDPLLDLGRRHGLVIVEDAAQAHGTLYRGQRCGSIGRLGCFSFYPAKNLGACGDGGIITTSDLHLAERLRCLRDYGQRSKYEHVERGLNSRLDAVQAGILSVKLRHLTDWNEARGRHAATYTRLLTGIGDIRFQQRASYSSHIYHLFIIETGRRDACRSFLGQRGISTGIHYPRPIHLQEAYRDLGHHVGDFPHAERAAQRMMSLPMYPELREDQIRRVVDGIQQFFKDSSRPEL